MSYRLLVVTHASEALRALSQELADVTVTVMDSANAALWELQSNPAEAMIAELDLPDMSGLDLAEILPNFGVSTRVLLWSATPNDAARKQAESAGVYQFIDGTTTTTAALHAALRAAMDEAYHAPQPEPEPEPEPPPPPPKAAPKPERSFTPARATLPTAEERAAQERAAEKPEKASFTPARVTLPTAEERAAEERAAEKPEKASFTPARVTLPSVEERNAAAAAAQQQPAAKGGLGSRAKAAAEKAATEKPAAPPAEQPFRRSAGTLVVTAENINPIRTVMSQLGQDLGAQSIILTDRAGMVLVEVGSTQGLPMMILLPLLSTSFSTAGEVARQLRDEDATTLYIHEGVSIDLYCFDVVQRFLLVLVFNKKVASSKIGAVWVNAKRAIRDLRDLLAKA
jgi:DNA-binding NarL/FixJ family response regulator